MSLVSRLSGFFLASLAAVLVGFSATLYLLAADHLHRQVDERLESALGNLVAAIPSMHATAGAGQTGTHLTILRIHLTII